MARLFSDLQWNASTREAHLNALIRLRQDENADQRMLFDYLYQSLNILDTKTGNLMRFNSFVFAICSLLVSPNLGSSSALHGGIFSPAVIAIVIGTLCSFLSGIVLLTVVWVHWSETADLADAHRHRHRLLEIRNSRTLRYRIAWILSLIALLGLILHLGLVGHRLISP